jgi:Zn-dependent protease
VEPYLPSLLQDLDLFDLLIRVFVLFTAMPVHEFAHAAAAVRLGDDTPIKEGRYTLNPFAHLSLLGSLALLFLRFGWAKPVRVDMDNFKRPKRDMAIVSLMGPVSNILLALLALIFLKLLAGFTPGIYMNNAGSRLITLLEYAVILLSYVIEINLLLAVFNLLPIPPLDGSKVLAVLLPYRAYNLLMRYEGVVTVVLLLLLYTGYLFTPLNIISAWIKEALHFITTPIDWMFGWGS